LASVELEKYKLGCTYSRDKVNDTDKVNPPSESAKFLLKSVWDGSLGSMLQNEPESPEKTHFVKWLSGIITHPNYKKSLEKDCDTDKLLAYISSLSNPPAQTNPAPSQSSLCRVSGYIVDASEKTRISGIARVEVSLHPGKGNILCSQPNIHPFIDASWDGGIANCRKYLRTPLNCSVFLRQYDIHYSFTYAPTIEFSKISDTSASAMMLFLIEVLFAKADNEALTPKLWKLRRDRWRRYRNYPVCITGALDSDGAIYRVGATPLKYVAVKENNHISVFGFPESNLSEVHQARLNRDIAEYETLSRYNSKQFAVCYADRYETLADKMERLVFQLNISKGLQPPLPYTDAGHLRGRESDLNNLHAKLTGTTVPIVLHGDAGVGKTALALEFAHQYAQEFANGVIWINAESAEEITASLQSLAKSCLQEVDARESPFDSAKRLVSRVRELGDALIIFDNAPSSADNSPQEEAWKEWWDQFGDRNTFLITRQMPLRDCTNIHVLSLSRDAGGQMLLNQCGKTSPSVEEVYQAEMLSDTLQGNPLVLEQAAAYMNAHQISLEEFELALKRELAASDQPAEEIPFILSLRYLRTHRPGVFEFIALCSALAPMHIPEWIFTDGCDYLPQRLKAAVSSLYDEWLVVQREAEERKFVFGITTIDLLPENRHAFKMHPYVQRVVRRYLQQEIVAEATGTESSPNAVALLRSLFKANLPARKKIAMAPHLRQLAIHSSEFGDANRIRFIECVAPCISLLVRQHAFRLIIFLGEAVERLGTDGVAKPVVLEYAHAFAQAIHMEEHDHDRVEAILSAPRLSESDRQEYEWRFDFDRYVLLNKTCRVRHQEGDIPDGVDLYQRGLNYLSEAEKIWQNTGYSLTRKADLSLLRAIFLRVFDRSDDLTDSLPERASILLQAHESLRHHSYSTDESTWRNRFLLEFGLILEELKRNGKTMGDAEITDFQIITTLSGVINSDIEVAGSQYRRSVAYDYALFAEVLHNLNLRDAAIDNYKTATALYDALGENEDVEYYTSRMEDCERQRAGNTNQSNPI
jgi:hypothetical protein